MRLADHDTDRFAVVWTASSVPRGTMRELDRSSQEKLWPLPGTSSQGPPAPLLPLGIQSLSLPQVCALATPPSFLSPLPHPTSMPVSHSLPLCLPPSFLLSLARVDVAGAWTDTPPQAYELGGAVVTLALTINGDYPIKSTAMRIAK